MTDQIRTIKEGDPDCCYDCPACGGILLISRVDPHPENPYFFCMDEGCDWWGYLRDLLVLVVHGYSGADEECR
jgi:hypothetical protein